jgi:hypothetical protein
MPQPGSSDYRTAPLSNPHGHTEGVMDQLSEAAGTASEQARELAGKAGTLAGELGTAVKERPFTTLAIAAGLAFAVGALWKLNHSRPQSRLDSFRAQLPEMPSKVSLLPRRWR